MYCEMAATGEIVTSPSPSLNALILDYLLTNTGLLDFREQYTSESMAILYGMPAFGIFVSS